MLRHPAVAGQFYQDTPERLRNQVASYLVQGLERKQAIAVLAPHAGLMYSGPVAGAVYSTVAIPDAVILIGPNHTGLGAPVSLMAEGTWETPLGSVAIDTALAKDILARSAHVRSDTLAHLREHSLEVQLPFLQYLKPEFTFVPIQMLDVRLETCLELGRAVAGAIREYRSAIDEGRRMKDEAKQGGVLLVASSDMSHYEQAAVAKEKDFKAIDAILRLDPEGLYRAIRSYDITMCGFGPATAVLTAAKLLGASRAELVKYANSGDVSGDYDQVVGYAGIVIL